MKRKAIAVALMIVALMAVVPSTTAQADSTCKFTTTHDIGSATVTNKGGCNTVSVQHQYYIASGSMDYWTAWKSGQQSATSPYQTTYIALNALGASS